LLKEAIEWNTRNLLYDFFSFHEPVN
jgi:hypothetical protein